MTSACAHLWNATVSLWVSPLAFRARALVTFDQDIAACEFANPDVENADNDEIAENVPAGLHGFADQPMPAREMAEKIKNSHCSTTLDGAGRLFWLMATVRRETITMPRPTQAATRSSAFRGCFARSPRFL